MKTGLFFLYSIILFFSFWFSWYNYSKLSVIVPYTIYIIFLIWAFKDIKFRFLAYPFVILNLVFGLFYYEAAGLSSSNVVGLGYVSIYMFIFIVVPLMLLALVAGVIFDIKDLLKKNKNQ